MANGDAATRTIQTVCAGLVGYDFDKERKVFGDEISRATNISRKAGVVFSVTEILEANRDNPGFYSRSQIQAARFRECMCV
jgi:hypothetical protein